MIRIQRAKQASGESQTLASFAHGFARITDDEILLTAILCCRSAAHSFTDLLIFMDDEC